MIVVVPLGGFRADAIGTLAIVMGQKKATGLIDDLETYIEGRARAGAESAIPEIRAQVRDEAQSAVRPWVIGALALSTVAMGIGGYALWRGQRRGRR